MTPRERIITALHNGTPDIAPLSIYDAFVDDPEADRWQRLFDQGLGICAHCPVLKAIEHGVTSTSDVRTEGDHIYRIFRKETPIGTLQRVTHNGWHHEDWIKSPRDYKIRQWILEHTELVPDCDAFEASEAKMGNFGVTAVMGAGAWASRTPAMSINIDWAGTQQFCLDLALGLDELFELYEVQKKYFMDMTRLIAAGPGQFVKWPENLTISMLGPQRYAELLMPIYEAAAPVLIASGKRIMVHYDGALKVIADQIARAPYHIIDSLNEPPEGDMMFDECRAAWPDKVLWAHINLELYMRSAHELRDAVLAMRARSGKRGVAFEISEHLPQKWETSIPVVLDALREAG